MPNAPKNPVVILGRSYYHLRVDYRSDADLEMCLRYLKQTSAKNIIVAHEVSKEVQKNHIHCIFDETLSLARLRAKFHERFETPYDGKKKEYCFEHVEGELEAAERYLCKGEALGKYDIRLNTGKYEDELVNARNAQYWEIHDEIRKAHTMKPLDGSFDAFAFKKGTQVIIHEHVTAPRKSRSFIADVVAKLELEIEHMTEKQICFDGTNVLDATRLDEFEWFSPPKVKSHARYVVTTILKMHGKNFKPYSDAQIENEYNAVVQCLAPDYQTKTMIDRLKHRGNIPL